MSCQATPVRRRAVRAVVLSIFLAVALAACSSNSSQSSTKANTSATNSAASGLVAQARSQVARLESRPTTLKVPSLPKAPASGKTLDFLSCPVAQCVAFDKVIEDAAAAVGWHADIVQLGGTVQTVSAAWGQVIRNKPAGVIAATDPLAWFSTDLKELKALNIPVVLLDYSSWGDATGAVLTGANQATYGADLGWWILDNAGGHDAHVAIFSTPETAIYSYTHQAMTAVLHKCATCTVDTYSAFSITDVGTNLPNMVVTYLRSHPSTNYLMFDFVDETTGVPAALKSAGFRNMHIITTDDDALGASEIKAGQVNATAGVPWPEMIWAGFGAVLATTEGASPEPYLQMDFPQMIETNTNLIAEPTNGATVPLVANYQSLFKQAWHV